METETLNIDEILIRILNNRATREEILYFSKWIEEGENRVYFEKFKKLWNLSAGKQADLGLRQSGLNDYCRFMEKSMKPRRKIKWIGRIASVAAMALILIGSVLWFSERGDQATRNGNQVSVKSGKNVILTFADGKQVNVLSDSLALWGKIGNDVRISKNNQRGIVYEVNDSSVEQENQELAYNQIIVPVGERFSVQLSDGTKVWINSESSLRYPVRFGKDKREVEVRGNVYFEVTKDAGRPFRVIAREITTEVLGTSFEVNTYGDGEMVSTTLVEGSVRVSAGTHAVIIKPDQEAVFNTKSGSMEVSEVDAANKVRWKDGVLVIDNERFDDVVKKLERWYGVAIVNETGMSFTQFFSGEFDREDIHVAIETICINLGLQYKMDKDSVFLRK